MSHMLVGKLRWTAAYAEAAAQYDAARRLLHILLLYNRKFGRELEPGKKYELDLGLTHTDLGSLVGTGREWVSRLLSKWRSKGLIDVDNGVITILDLPRVEAERNRWIQGDGDGFIDVVRGFFELLSCETGLFLIMTCIIAVERAQDFSHRLM